MYTSSMATLTEVIMEVENRGTPHFLKMVVLSGSVSGRVFATTPFQARESAQVLLSEKGMARLKPHG